MKITAEADFPILSDKSKETSIKYGIYNLFDDGVAAPATFIITPDGAVAWRYVGKDIVDRKTPLQILERVEALVQ